MNTELTEHLRGDYWPEVYIGDLVMLLLALFVFGKGLSKFREENKSSRLYIRFISLPSDTHGNGFFFCVIGTILIILNIYWITTFYIEMHIQYFWECIGLFAFLIFGGTLFFWLRFLRRK
jgi:hypothetical protein